MRGLDNEILDIRIKDREIIEIFNKAKEQIIKKRDLINSKAIGKNIPNSKIVRIIFEAYLKNEKI